MSEKTPIAENIGTLSVKDAFAADVEALKFRSTVIIDPAPMRLIPKQNPRSADLPGGV